MSDHSTYYFNAKKLAQYNAEHNLPRKNPFDMWSEPGSYRGYHSYIEENKNFSKYLNKYPYMRENEKQVLEEYGYQTAELMKNKGEEYINPFMTELEFELWKGFEKHVPESIMKEQEKEPWTEGEKKYIESEKERYKQEEANKINKENDEKKWFQVGYEQAKSQWSSNETCNNPYSTTYSNKKYDGFEQFFKDLRNVKNEDKENKQKELDEKEFKIGYLVAQNDMKNSRVFYYGFGIDTQLGKGYHKYVEEYNNELNKPKYVIGTVLDKNFIDTWRSEELVKNSESLVEEFPTEESDVTLDLTEFNKEVYKNMEKLGKEIEIKLENWGESPMKNVHKVWSDNEQIQKSLDKSFQHLSKEEDKQEKVMDLKDINFDKPEDIEEEILCELFNDYDLNIDNWKEIGYATAYSFFNNGMELKNPFDSKTFTSDGFIMFVDKLNKLKEEQKKQTEEVKDKDIPQTKEELKDFLIGYNTAVIENTFYNNTNYVNPYLEGSQRAKGFEYYMGNYKKK